LNKKITNHKATENDKPTTKKLDEISVVFVKIILKSSKLVFLQQKNIQKNPNNETPLTTVL